MKIAVFGGTFDPVHNGHLALAELVLEHRSADRILFVPAPHPPHKTDRIITPFDVRCEMLALALEGKENVFALSDRVFQPLAASLGILSKPRFIKSQRALSRELPGEAFEGREAPPCQTSLRSSPKQKAPPTRVNGAGGALGGFLCRRQKRRGPSRIIGLETLRKENQIEAQRSGFDLERSRDRMNER